MQFSYSPYSYTEENYLKAIFKLSERTKANITTNAIAERLNTKAASVTDMLKKLNKKELIKYKRYNGVVLTSEGKAIAILIIRKHRLWEYFLVNKLNFKWDQVHEIAEQLEHIKSKVLIDKLDTFLGKPKYDPHGDPIPTNNGQIRDSHKITADNLNEKNIAIIVGVKDHSNSFLQYLDKLNLTINKKIKVLNKIEYDNSMLIILDGKAKLTISKKVSENLYVEKIK